MLDRRRTEVSMAGTGSVKFETLVAQGHQARAAHRFAEAHAAFSRAAQHGELSTDEILAWGDAAWWLGRADQALALAETGHQRLIDEGQPVLAAMEAMSLGFLLLLRGELAAGSGWLQRGRSLVEGSRDEQAMGYVLHLDAEEALASNDAERAIALAQRARQVGHRGGDAALTSLALMTEGIARLRTGGVPEAMALLDEAMLPVQAGRVAPEFAGNLYCQMIATCWELADLRRAREWTAATERWCEQFDSSVMFSGICRMHRVQLRHVAGDWDTAEAEARVVCDELADMNTSVIAEGHYLMGELLRLRGSSAQAEDAYRRAHELGRDPHPGLALLRAASGNPTAARTSLETALVAQGERVVQRAPLLRALVEVAAETGEVSVAQDAADELADIAQRWPTDGLRAAAAHGRGAAALAAGSASAAIAPLREAVRCWQDVDAPYDVARARVLLASAYATLGDDEAARLERGAAATAFERLGASVDLERLERQHGDADPPGGLTRREAEIIALVAEGITNRQVADRLVISEKTVARHLANAYLKLGVTTRTAAAAWARRHGLGGSA